MKKLVAAAAAALLLGVVAPVASHAAARTPTTSPPPRFSPALHASLAKAAPADRLVVLVRGTDGAAAEHAVAAAGLHRITVLRSVGVVAASGTAAQIAELQHASGVVHVEPNLPLDLYADDTADVASRTAAARATTSPVLDPQGHPYTGAGHTIAIVDGGIDGTHPMFRRPDGTSKVVRNFKVACPPELLSGVDTCPSDHLLVDMAQTPHNDTDSISAGGHGTHVASIAAGVPVQFGKRTLMGTAPGADLVGISVGTGINILTADIALDWIARNHSNPCADLGKKCNPITVVNNSYGPDGGGEFDPASTTAQITSQLVKDGVVMVWANGNGDTTDTNNRGGDGTKNRSNPEAQNPLPGVIGVANYDDQEIGTRDGTLDSTSSRGDASRPATWPDVSAPGSNITAACRPYLAICSSQESDPNFGTISGTSMASPHVAGIVALLQQAKPGITPAQVEDALEDTAHRFQFGAGYAPDPTNPTTPSSFDKGHGLVDATAALQDVRFGTVASSAGTCTGTTGTDAAAEPQPYAVAAASGPYDPSVDLRGVALTGDATKGTVTLRLDVEDVTGAPPSGGVGQYAEATFIVGTATHTMTITTDFTGTTGEVDGNAADDGAATIDPDKNTMTLTVKRAAFDPDLGGTFHVGGVNVQLGRLLGASGGGLILWADSASAGCGDIAVGGTAPAPPPPPAKPVPVATITPGKPYTWTSAPATVVSDPVGAGLSQAVEGEHEESKLVTVHAPAGATLTFSISCANAADDYDITLNGPDGKPIGTGAAFPGSDPSTGESANPGCGESITVKNAPSGSYTAKITAFTTVHGTYDGTIKLG